MSRTKTRAASGAAAVFVASLVVLGCRGQGPSEDPKMPANSPLPDIDRPDDPHSAPDVKPDAG